MHFSILLYCRSKKKKLTILHVLAKIFHENRKFWQSFRRPSWRCENHSHPSSARWRGDGGRSYRCASTWSAPYTSLEEYGALPWGDYADFYQARGLFGTYQWCQKGAPDRSGQPAQRQWCTQQRGLLQYRSGGAYHQDSQDSWWKYQCLGTRDTPLPNHRICRGTALLQGQDTRKPWTTPRRRRWGVHRYYGSGQGHLPKISQRNNLWRTWSAFCAAKYRQWFLFDQLCSLYLSPIGRWKTGYIGAKQLGYSCLGDHQVFWSRTPKGNPKKGNTEQSPYGLWQATARLFPTPTDTDHSEGIGQWVLWGGYRKIQRAS